MSNPKDTVDSSLKAPRYQVLVGAHYEYANDGIELDGIIQKAFRELDDSNQLSCDDFAACLRIRVWRDGREYST